VLGQASSASAFETSAGVKGTNAGVGAGVLGVGDKLGVYGRRGAGYYSTLSPFTVFSGVRGDSDTGAGVVGESTLGSGVFGRHLATNGTNPGVNGGTDSASANATGVLGVVTSIGPGSFSAGVKGDNAGTGANGIGVWGTHHGAGWGVYGSSPKGRGVYGEATGTSGVNYGVIGKTSSPSGYAAYFMGKVHITGNLEVGGPYAQLPDRTGAPPAADCDSSAEAGRVVVRTDGSLNLYICRGSAGWIAK
jgi:hypothetical protein